MRISDWSSDVCSSDLFAGEGVDDDLRGSGAVGIVVELPALAGLAVPMDLRRLVKAGGGQGYARHVGRLDEVGEDDLLIADAHVAPQELQIRRAHVSPPVTHAHLLSPLLLAPKQPPTPSP